MKQKPAVVVEYNAYMLGVDKMDQLVTYYSFVHKTVKWWRKVFFWMLEVATVNSYILYKEESIRNGVRPMSHLGFRHHLIDILSQPLLTMPRVRMGPRAVQSLERLQNTNHFLTKGTKRKDCVVCSSRETGGTRHLTLFSCSTCTTRPALCPSNCFKVYHTQRSIHV